MECFFKKSLEYSKELQKVLRGIRSIGNTFGEGTDEYEEELQKVLNDIHSIENTLDNIFLERSREYKEKFGKLLDEVYLTCPRGQMVHDWVKFPDSDELKGKRDENIFPDKYEREYAEKTQIDEIPAIDYIKELAAHSGISNIDDSKFIST